MDRETIEALGAGREMDAAVGRAFPELVSGWNYLAEATNGCGSLWSGISYPTPEAALEAVADRKPVEGHGPWKAVPAELFSQDIAAAWQVVPVLISRGRKVTIEVTAAGCEVTISGTTEVLGSFVEARAATVPLALCGAALLTALGG